MVIELLPNPGVAPLPKVVVDRRGGWEILGEQAPSTTGEQEVEQGVEHLSEVSAAGTTGGSRRRQKRFEQFPLVLGEVSYVH
jgi:hypothetical protein